MDVDCVSTADRHTQSYRPRLTYANTTLPRSQTPYMYPVAAISCNVGGGGRNAEATEGWGCPFCLALILYFWLIASLISMWLKQSLFSWFQSGRRSRFQSIGNVGPYEVILIKGWETDHFREKIAFKTRGGDDPPRQIPRGTSPPGTPPMHVSSLLSIF